MIGNKNLIFMGNNYADFWDVGNGMRRGKDF
jgi:hypothetical protein